MRVVDRFSCHGIAPHDIRLLEDGKHVAISNYGSVAGSDGYGPGKLPHNLEPCVTILEAGSGRLAAKAVGSVRSNEIRHLVAPRLDRVFTIQARLGTFDDAAEAMHGYTEIYEGDVPADDGDNYLPAPMLGSRISGAETATVRRVTLSDPTLMRHGLGIVYDHRFDEVIATFVTPHCVVVLDAVSATVKRVIRTDRVGLQYPCGLALHPDGEHYVVAGYWRDLYLFRRGTHEPVPAATRYVVLFGHSHLAAA